MNFARKEKLFLNEGLNEGNYLWNKFRKGNDQAFFLIYDQYADLLYKYAIHFSKDKDSVRDCIHDLFLNLYKYRNKLSETNNVKFYLFRSLRRILHSKKAKGLPLVYEDRLDKGNESHVSSHEDYLIEEETNTEKSIQLQKVIKTLSKRQIECLTLKFEHNLSYIEISEILGISVESARTNR